MKRAITKGVAGMLCILATPALANDQEIGPVATSSHLLLVEVMINGRLQDGQYLIARSGEMFMFRPADLAGWGLRVSEPDGVLVEGEVFIPASAFPGMTSRFQEARQRLLLVVPAELFAEHRILVETKATRPTDSAFAAFLNYDAALETDYGFGGTAFVEAGVSDDWGFAASTMTIGRGAAGEGGVTRLDSYYLRDNPETLTRLVMGDTVTSPTRWSRQVRFGGVRFGTEFSIRPDLITFPTPAFTGRTALPSSIELLVNGARRFQTEVGQGPFSIDQVPLVTGAGEVTLVTQDALGVERRVETSYYVSPSLLRQGLSSWSVEAGAERARYGIRSFDYRDPFAAGSFHHGLTDEITVGGRVELSGDVQMAGGDAALIIPAAGEFGLAGAFSRGKEGKGALYRLFFQRVTPVWNIGASYQRASNNFDQLGIDRDEERITEQVQASAGISLGSWGNIGAAYTDLRYASGDRTRLLSANYGATVGERGYLNVFALHSDANGSDAETSFGASFTFTFGSRSSAYLQADSHNITAEARQAPPIWGGLGYRVGLTAGETDRQHAQLDWRGDVGEFSIEAARYNGRSEARALARGGILFAGGQVRATRRIEGGIGVIEVPGQPNVRIYQESRLVTRTDHEGRAILPDLRSYEENRIALDPADLPIEMHMPKEGLAVVPRYRGAALARFQVKRQQPAIIVIQMPNGSPAPVGAIVYTDSGDETFVGYDGEVFVEHFRDHMTLELETARGSCEVTVPPLPSQGPLPRIGPLQCLMPGVQP